MSLIHADGYKCTKGAKWASARDGSCYQRALANATGLSFDDIYDNSIRTGIKKPGRSGSNVWKFDRQDPTKSLLIATRKVTKLSGWRGMKKLYRSGITLNQFVKRFPIGTYVIIVRSHALAIVDGVVYDNNDRTSGRHRVVAVVEYRPSEGEVKPRPKNQRGETRDERQRQLELQAEKLEANFHIYTGRRFAFQCPDTVAMVLGMKKELERVPAKTWDLLIMHRIQLNEFGPLW